MHIAREKYEAHGGTVFHYVLHSLIQKCMKPRGVMLELSSNHFCLKYEIGGGVLFFFVGLTCLNVCNLGGDVFQEEIMGTFFRHGNFH